MNYIYSFVIFLVGFILQTTILNDLSVFGVTPNILLCIVIIFAFLFDRYYSLVYGVIFGLLQDILFGQILGIAALCYLLIGLTVRVAKTLLNSESIVSAIILTVGGTLMFDFLFWGLTSLFGSVYTIVAMLKMLAVAILYNIMIAIILYKSFIRKVVRYPSDKYIKGTFINYE